MLTFAVPSLNKREFSSAGSEHLPYKQRVGGSNPSTPTTISYLIFNQVAFFLPLGWGWLWSPRHCEGAERPRQALRHCEAVKPWQSFFIREFKEFRDWSYSMRTPLPKFPNFPKLPNNDNAFSPQSARLPRALRLSQ